MNRARARSRESVRRPRAPTARSRPWPEARRFAPRDPLPGQLVQQRFGRVLPRRIAVEAEHDAADAMLLDQRIVIGRPAVDSVDRNCVCDARFEEAERIEDRLGDDDLLRRRRALRVHEAAPHAGKEVVAITSDRAAVATHHVSREIAERHDDASVHKLTPVCGHDAECLELRARLAPFWSPAQPMPSAAIIPAFVIPRERRYPCAFGSFASARA